MPDYHNPNDPFYHTDDDPLRRFDPDARAANAMWGWIAATVFFTVLALAIGIGHYRSHVGINTASNDMTPPPTINHMAPAPVTPRPPVTPAPNTPAQQGSSR